MTKLRLTVLIQDSRGQIVLMEKGEFIGGLKYLRRYLELLNPKLVIQEKTFDYPQFEELAELFRDND